MFKLKVVRSEKNLQLTKSKINPYSQKKNTANGVALYFYKPLLCKCSPTRSPAKTPVVLL